MKTFSFPENSIFGKYLFSENAFTRTKRSLRSNNCTCTKEISWKEKCTYFHNSLVSLFSMCLPLYSLSYWFFHLLSIFCSYIPNLPPIWLFATKKKKSYFGSVWIEIMDSRFGSNAFQFFFFFLPRVLAGDRVTV